MYGEIAAIASMLLIVLLLVVVIVLIVRRTKSSSPVQPTQGTSESLDHRPTRYSQLMLGDVEHPLAVIEPFELPEESRLESLPMNKQKLAHLQAIFRHAPSLAKSASAAASKTYVLRFPPEAARNIANGSSKMMESVKGGFHGIATDAQGKIVAHGTLVPASGVSIAAAATAVFQCLAIVTAQYYLPKINNRLLQIEQGIKDIQAHLAAQDKAVLVSSLKQLKSMAVLLEEGDLQEGDLLANLISLDSIDRDCGRVLEAYRDHMERYRSEFDGLKLTGWFKPNFAAAADKATQHEKTALICLQAMYVKSVTAQFRCAAPNAGRVAQAHRSLQELKVDLSAWHEDQESFAQQFEERIRNDTTVTLDLDELKKEVLGEEVLRDLGELPDDEDTLSNQRQQVIDEASKRQKSVIKLHDELEQTIGKATDHASRQLSASSEPLTLVVKLDEQNEIEQVSKLTA